MPCLQSGGTVTNFGVASVSILEPAVTITEILQNIDVFRSTLFSVRRFVRGLVKQMGPDVFCATEIATKQPAKY